MNKPDLFIITEEQCNHKRKSSFLKKEVIEFKSVFNINLSEDKSI